MKLYFLFFIFLIFNLVLTSAIGFSPSQLEYSLNINQESCSNVTITSEITRDFRVYDNWSEQNNSEWNAKEFNVNAVDYGLILNYSDTLRRVLGNKEVEICINGDTTGTYRGIMIFEGSTKTNVGVAVGIWLKVIISEPPAQTSSGSSGGGGGGGGSSAKTTATPSLTTLDNSNLNTNTQNLAGNIEKEGNISTEKSSGITGSAVDDIEGKKEVKKILIPLIALAIIGLIMYKWKTKK
ncbi:MAG: hypothetical protein KKA64_00640 [Nanoarchaeota archaeon]|nr:hypothetical protein [Nanoarchaeota archaeon]